MKYESIQPIKVLWKTQAIKTHDTMGKKNKAI
jgi:hypothetical protein